MRKRERERVRKKEREHKIDEKRDNIDSSIETVHPVHVMIDLLFSRVVTRLSLNMRLSVNKIDVSPIRLLNSVTYIYTAYIDTYTQTCAYINKS
jgi:hypothetical protein